MLNAAGMGETSAPRKCGRTPLTLGPGYMTETSYHKRTERFDGETSNRISDLICPSCGSKYLHRSRRHNVLERTLLSILRAKPYRCDDCDKRFYSRKSLAAVQN